MKTNQYRSHSIAAALAATFVTTVLVSSLVESWGTRPPRRGGGRAHRAGSALVESFEPAQLLRLEGKASETVIALDRRSATDRADWT